MDTGGGSFYSQHQEEVIFGVIAVIAVFFAWAISRKKTPTGADAQAASGTTKPVVEYIPTSESFTSIVENATDSNNVSAPGAPVSVGNVTTTTSPSPAPPSARPPVVARPAPSAPSLPPPVVIGPGPVPPRQPTPAPAPPPTQVSGSDPHAPRPKDPSFTAQTAGGWWANPGAVAQGDPHWLERTGHYLAHGFGAYYWTHGGGSAFGGPVSEEYRDPASGANRQDFEKGTMFWQPGTDPSNYDVRWVAGGLGGAALPHGATQSSGPRFAYGQHVSPTTLPVTATHTVAMGQTLTDIGVRYGLPWQKIYLANKDKIDAASHAQGHPIPGGPWNNIVAGMSLGIPAG